MNFSLFFQGRLDVPEEKKVTFNQMPMHFIPLIFLVSHNIYHTISRDEQQVQFVQSMLSRFYVFNEHHSDGLEMEMEIDGRFYFRKGMLCSAEEEI